MERKVAFWEITIGRVATTPSGTANSTGLIRLPDCDDFGLRKPVLQFQNVAEQSVTAADD